MIRPGRKTAIVLALSLAGALGAGAAPLASSASADTVDDVVCYVKTGNAYVCFRMGPQ